MASKTRDGAAGSGRPGWPTTMTCPACKSHRWQPVTETGRLQVVRCRSCSHLLASHPAGDARPAVDYHCQYEQDGYPEALRATRIRQAGLILKWIREQLAEPQGLLDFGAGRGWFLQVCREQGMPRLAGADTSEAAVEAIERAGAQAIHVPYSGAGPWDPGLGGLEFRPQVLTVLDVIEHFPPERLQEMLTAIVEVLLPDLKLVVVKVPLASGQLYRGAALLSALGSHGALEQLYQVGTDPPHLSYFTPRSMRLLLAQVGLAVRAEYRDVNFEADQLGTRVAVLRRLPRTPIAWLGSMAAAIGGALRLGDTGIFIASPAAQP